MSKELERDLGLVAVVAISMGAMIGSGIFILPGLAMAEAGPSVILAFLIASVLVVPAAISIAELGTAIPEAGGDYVFIERGIGPSVGTIAGLGTWMMLMFKGALALVGGMFYIDYVFQLPSHTAAAVVIATVLILVNLIGVKQTGSLQTIMVVVMLAIMAAFVVGTILRVDGTRYEPFLTEGTGGLFSATAMVLVSYAGVTKIAAVAEEIENPGRNLPLGLLISLVATTLLYTLIVFVLVGIVEADLLSDHEAPMALAVDELFGYVAVVAIVFAALLALVSTANAGILTASRYPLAMSRDRLLPEMFEYIHARFRTPVIAILVTGGVMVAIIVTLPVDEIAKTAGAFQIVVYILVCAALIAFRERDLEWYDPDFRSPAYPWVQLFGIGSGIFIITQMDPLPIVGGVGIVVVGYLFYRYYASERVDREGLAVGLARRETGRRFVRDTEEKLKRTEEYQVLIAIRRDVTREQEDGLLRIAAPLVRHRGGRIRVVRFDEVPDQVPLDTAAGELSPRDVEFERRTDELAEDLDVPIDVGEIVSHDSRHAVVNFADRSGVDLILARNELTSRLGTLLGRDTDWIMEHAPCDVVFTQHTRPPETNEIAIVTDRSPFNDPLKVEVANTIADEIGASLRFVYAVRDGSSDSLIETVEDYHDELDDLCTVPVESTILRTDRPIDDLATTLADADLIVLSTVTHRRIPDLIVEQRSDRLAARIDRPILLVHSQKTHRGTFLRPILERVLFE